MNEKYAKKKTGQKIREKNEKEGKKNEMTKSEEENTDQKDKVKQQIRLTRINSPP